MSGLRAEPRDGLGSSGPIIAPVHLGTWHQIAKVGSYELINSKGAADTNVLTNPDRPYTFTLVK
ncbi:MAG: hypothetical protein JWR50_4392 [Mucilaginibacter sp.]|nr:hypothetical protein [Mucilaginibacter sp.]